VVAVLTSSSLVAVATPAQATTSPACPAAGISVASLNAPRFYIDTAQNQTPKMTAGYAGYMVSSTSARSDLWVRVSNFTGGQVRLPATQPAAIPVGAVPAGQGKPAYFLLEAPATSSSVQAHTVEVLSGAPGTDTSTVVCTKTGSFGAVEDTQKTQTNGVSNVSLSPAQPHLGETFEITVTGTTGTIGAGTTADPNALYITPSALPSWPAGQLRLVGTKLTISPDGTSPQQTYTDVLRRGSLGSTSRPYTAVYRFAAAGTTASVVSAYPIQQIASGTQIKHTDLSTTTVPSIPAAANTLSVAVAANPLTVAPSARSTVTQTLASTSTGTAEIDQLLLRLPTGATLVPGSAKYRGVSILDPTTAGSDLAFPGPFATSSSTPGTLEYRVDMPATEGSYSISAWGLLGSTLIDTTATTSDDVRASTTVRVVAPKAQTITFTQPGEAHYGSAVPALQASTTSELPVAFSSLTPDTCTVTGSAVTLADVGTCTVRAQQAGDAEWLAATAIDRSFTVTRGAQSISAPAPTDTRLDAEAPLLGATVTSALAVTWAAGPSEVCSVQEGVLVLHAVGTCSLTASQAGDARWAPADDLIRTFEVLRKAPRSQTITFTQPDDVRLDLGPITLQSSASSELPVTFGSLTPSVCVLDENDRDVVRLRSEGTCQVQATQDGDGDFTAATPVTRSFTVQPARADQTITFTQPDDVRIHRDHIVVQASTTSELPVAFRSLTPDVCNIDEQDGDLVLLLDLGTCEVQATQDGDDTWAAAAAIRSF